MTNNNNNNNLPKRSAGLNEMNRILNYVLEQENIASVEAKLTPSCCYG